MRAANFRNVMQGVCRHDGLDYFQVQNVQEDFGEYVLNDSENKESREYEESFHLEY